jgi:glutathione synthase/RimK-type ligase-like ATP-grasp enzyme
MAILFDPEEIDSPSDDRAIKRFIRAAKKFNMSVSIIGKEDFGRIPEFDALFIRQTTYVNHFTYRFASRAEAEGLVVIDDPESIVRCTNKVYQAELFDRNEIPCPRTLVVHWDIVHDVGKHLGFPCVLKRPDSSFSAGVVKAKDQNELNQKLETFFEKSELVVAQEYAPSTFDWRVGVLDGKPLYLSKYYMASGHWQIQKTYDSTVRRHGRVETLAVEDGPPELVKLGVRAANLIGRGLYGVDIKEVNGRYLVMEVNDNPSIDAGYEDAVLKEELYMAIMRTFYERLTHNEDRKRNRD